MSTPARITPDDPRASAPGVVNVGRGTRWANPYAAQIRGGERGLATDSRQYLVDDFARWLLAPATPHPRDGSLLGPGSYRSYLGVPYADRPTLEAIREALAGRDLVCRCPVGQPCHGDVLLAVANGWEVGDDPRW